MPKRPISELECEDSRLQSKIHVGLKEINRGICADFNMKAVYRKSTFPDSCFTDSSFRLLCYRKNSASPVPRFETYQFGRRDDFGPSVRFTIQVQPNDDNFERIDFQQTQRGSCGCSTCDLTRGPVPLVS